MSNCDKIKFSRFADYDSDNAEPLVIVYLRRCDGVGQERDNYILDSR